MRVEIKIEPSAVEPHADIYASEITDEVEDAVKFLTGDKNRQITGIKDKKIFIVNPREIVCFFSEGQGVFFRAKGEKYAVRARLYELEERFGSLGFVRISSSAIANAGFIDCIEMYYNGTMKMQFKDGFCEYVSRRYVSRIKDYLKL